LLAYTLYTSGSTGEPKGVDLTHRAALTLVYWMIDTFDLDTSMRQLVSTTYTFDVSIHEIFTTLVVGGTLVLAPEGCLLDPRGLDALIRVEQCTFVAFVPSFTSVFLETCRLGPTVRSIASVGEALPPSLCKYLWDRCDGCPRVANLWGPTECSTYATVHFASPADGDKASVSIGKPCTNRLVYILDDRLQPCAIDVAGEMYLAGPSLARGYRNRDDLTLNSFFEATINGKKMLVYRTGDLGRWRADGAIDFLGRADFQVKIRGLRIELGEIEVVASEIKGVREVVAVVQVDSREQKKIVVFVTPEGVSESSVMARCREKLPKYMVPSAVVCLSEWPRTSSNKIHRSRLTQQHVVAESIEDGFVIREKKKPD